MNYKELASYAKSKGHKAFCAPLAMALVTGYDYMRCHDLLTEKGYRESKTSGTKVGWAKLLEEEGFILTKVKTDGIKTNITLKGKLNPDMKFIIAYRKHIAAYVGGELEDWSGDRRKRILSIHRVSL